MLLLLGILLCTGLSAVTVRGSETPADTLTRTSYAHGEIYGCSEKFSEHRCWRYCGGSSERWCYTVKTQSNHCTDDIDCTWALTCQGWCAWNSPRGCSKACHEEVVVKPQEQRPQCRPGRPWWECQSSYYTESEAATTGGKWISPDIPNDRVMNATANSIIFNGNKATAAKQSTLVPKIALWYPIGEIRVTSTTLYWTFTIRQTGTSPALHVGIGLSDLNKITASGWEVKGLFYNGANLSDGSGSLIDKYGPKLVDGDKCSILVKLINSRMKVYFILNGKSLGLAFDVPEDTLDGIYPVVKFHGEAFEVEIEEGSIFDAPANLEPVKPLALEGNWTLHSLVNGKAEVVAPIATMLLAELYDRAYDHVYKLRMHAVNRFIGKLTKISKSKWIGEIVDKTVKEGTASEMELEAAIFRHISGIRNVVLDTVENELILESAADSTTSVWKLNESRRTTVNINPFRNTKN